MLYKIISANMDWHKRILQNVLSSEFIAFKYMLALTDRIAKCLHKQGQQRAFMQQGRIAKNVTAAIGLIQLCFQKWRKQYLQSEKSVRRIFLQAVLANVKGVCSRVVSSGFCVYCWSFPLLPLSG